MKLGNRFVPTYVILFRTKDNMKQKKRHSRLPTQTFLENIHEEGQKVTKIESEVGLSLDTGSFLLRQVTAGHEIEAVPECAGQNGIPASLPSRHPP